MLFHDIFSSQILFIYFSDFYNRYLKFACQLLSIMSNLVEILDVHCAQLDMFDNVYI